MAEVGAKAAAFTRAFGRFWYDFVIGDDWKIAVSVVSALVVLLILILATSLSDAALTVVGGVLIVLFFSISLAVDVRAGSRR
jgi:hypothetical protein